MVTIQDVAKKAGVSKATVSRVLNGKNVVREDMRQRVFRAIEETGFSPNLLARQLATRKTNSMGLVITNSLYQGPFFSEMTYQAASCSEKHQRQLILADGKNSAEDERNAIGMLLALRCEAIIVYPKFLSAEALETLIEQHETPIIVINRKLPHHQNHAVYIEHYHSSQLMTHYLLEQGHRRIAFIAGLPGSPSGEQRLAGFLDTLKAAGIEHDEALLLEGDWTPESGYRAAQTLLARNLDVTCVLAANDDMAIGAAKVFLDAGMRVPQDMSLAGFDDMLIGRYFSPALTTVHVPIVAMIQDAIGRLVAASQGDAMPTPPCHHQGRLVIRESVARR
ncbi:LacI family DNA-binding transcriptional regulator [Symbiopectobacterium purcellii]|uniref:LacI family transcriptional regulator n=1 Tax=Symbiopectobacterium purcellii TaxID=2871826 RepID=A0ABX9ATB3_9ENTR|nr:LacI family DNA-binding transcriptional regulator [Symbiopectobacterium purcellii]QZN96215.1 LacI family transcriptional regulator [Symbiopectobacterium purcellii]